MKTSFLAAALIAMSASLALAEDSDLSSKVMKDLPGTKGGVTANPTAKPDSGSLSEKQMQNQPGVNTDKTGTTATPNAKPSDGSISSKVMEDTPGARK